MRRILRTPAAAEYVGLRPPTLEKLRVRGEGPKFVKLGTRTVGYDIADLDDWIEKRKVSSTSERPAGDAA
jgi:predicted DNA-binding transcriptional regulator AlpA